MEYIKKASKILINVLLLFILIITLIIVYNIVQVNFFNKEYYNFFGYTFFKVATGSMSGSIETGDIVIAKLGNQNINVNDIIVYKQEDYIITHRIIEIEEENITTKGDANNTEDKPITKENVIGKVIKVIHNVSIWENVLKTPKVFILMIITGTLFIITILFNSIEKKDMEVKKDD